MIFWKQLRIPFLAITLGGVLFVLVEVILAPSANKPAVEGNSPETGYRIHTFKYSYFEQQLWGL